MLSSDIVKVGFLYFSTLLESTLCLPQTWTNFYNQSTSGLNNSLVASWILGDLFKFSYFIHSKSEMAFIVCAIIQILVDCVIILQIFYYNFLHSKRSNEDKEMSEKDINTADATNTSRSSSVIPLKEAASVEFMEEK